MTNAEREDGATGKVKGGLCQALLRLFCISVRTRPRWQTAEHCKQENRRDEYDMIFVPVADARLLFILYICLQMRDHQ